MATTSQENGFDRVKRWGKELLAAGEAGTGARPAEAGADLTPRRPPGRRGRDDCQDNAIQSSSRLAACTRRMGASSRSAAGSFVARACLRDGNYGSKTARSYRRRLRILCWPWPAGPRSSSALRRCRKETVTGDGPYFRQREDKDK
jgi:hypothetical protein